MTLQEVTQEGLKNPISSLGRFIMCRKNRTTEGDSAFIFSINSDLKFCVSAVHILPHGKVKETDDDGGNIAVDLSDILATDWEILDIHLDVNEKSLKLFQDGTNI